MGTSVVITSGKGGTGKTSLTAGIASCLAALGRKVLCVDADVGLRNLDLVLGMSDLVLMDFTDVIDNRCPLDAAVVEHPVVKNLYLLTAPITQTAAQVDPARMAELIATAKAQFDYCLIDAPAGVGAGFHLAAAGADRALVVATADATSLRDAQRTSVLMNQYTDAQHLVVNRVKPKLLRRMETTIDDAMDLSGLPLLGLVPEDENVSVAANRGKPVITIARKGAPVAFLNLATRLEGRSVPLMKIR